MPTMSGCKGRNWFQRRATRPYIIHGCRSKIQGPKGCALSRPAEQWQAYTLGRICKKASKRRPPTNPSWESLETEVAVDQADQQELDRINVNVIRKFTGRGMLVWGGKTISSDSIWKYVNVRRTANYLEKSIFDGTNGSRSSPMTRRPGPWSGSRS